MDDATFQQLMQMWAGPQPAPAQSYISPSPYLNGGPSSFPTGLEYADHPGIGYMGANMPPQASVAENGIPYEFYGGRPVDYSRPAVNMDLNAAAATEGQRFNNSEATRGSPQGISDEDAGQTMNYMGVSGGVTPQQWTPPGKLPYDYYQGNLESGRNISRSDIPAAYDAQKLAEGANATSAGFGAPGQDASAGAFVDQPRSVEQAKQREIRDLIGEPLTYAMPGIGEILAGRDVGRSVTAAANAPDTKSLALNLGAAGLNAAGVLPGMKTAKRFGEEAAAAARGEMRPVFHDDGTLATVRRFDPDGRTTESALFRSPSSTLNMFVGPKAGPDAAKMIEQAKALEKQGASRETIWQKTHEDSPHPELIGAVKGADGNWRAELDDGRTVVPETKNFTDSSPLTAPQFTERYPDAKVNPDIKANRFWMGPPSGEYNTRTGNLRVRAAGAAEGKETLTHELNHAAASQEGWNAGTSIFNERFKAALGKNPVASNEGFELYRHDSEETLARAAGRRAAMTPEERAARPPWLDFDIPNERQIVPTPFKLGGPATAESYTPPGGWKTVNPDYPNLSENGKIKFKQGYAERSDPQRMQELQQHYDTVSNTTKPQDFKASLDALRSSKAVDSDTRDYLAKVSQYVRNDPENGHGNALVEAYMKASGGKMYQPVPVDGLYNAYQPIAQARLGGDRAAYVKDRGKFDQHLQTYGRSSDAELGGKTPSLAKPWLVQDGMVSLSPYIPKVDMNPVSKLPPALPNPAAQPSAQTMAISNNLASKTGDVPKKTGGTPRFDYESIHPGISQLPYQEQLNIRRQISRRADNPNPNPRGRPPWKRKLVWKDEE